MKTRWNDLDSFKKAYYKGFAEGAIIALVMWVIVIFFGILLPLFFLLRH